MHLKFLRPFAVAALTVGAVVGMLPLVTMDGPSQARATAAQAKRADPAPASSLAGIVRDFEGRPLAGATVVAGAFSQRRNHLVATTGQDGRFAFQANADAEKLSYVLAYKEGLAPASKFLLGFVEDAPAGDVELVLMRAEPFVGIVQDRDGRAVGGARVRIRYHARKKEGNSDQYPVLENVVQDTPLESLFIAVTDNQGGFRFPAVPAPQGVVLNVSAAGLADLSTEVPGDRKAGFISGSEAMPARLTMEPEARVQGRLVTQFPRVSVAGVKVGLQSTHDSTSFWRDTLTDADGRFEMRGLPEGGGNLFPYGPPERRSLDVPRDRKPVAAPGEDKRGDDRADRRRSGRGQGRRGRHGKANRRVFSSACTAPPARGAAQPF